MIFRGGRRRGAGKRQRSPGAVGGWFRLPRALGRENGHAREGFHVACAFGQSTNATPALVKHVYYDYPVHTTFYYHSRQYQMYIEFF